jgi:hypothetical protein
MGSDMRKIDIQPIAVLVGFAVRRNLNIPQLLGTITHLLQWA